MMSERQRVRELEQLSAFLDGELNETEQKQIESRLASEAELHEVYEGLRKTKLLFSRLRRVRAPRSFALTPEMVKVRKQKRPFFTGVRWATSAAAILLVVIFGAEQLFGNMLAASAPMAAEPVFESLEMEQDTATLAEEEPNTKAAEPEPLIIWGVPGAGGGGDAVDGLGGGGGMPPEELPTDTPPSETRAFDDTEGESLILGINTDQAGEVTYSDEEKMAESPSTSWLAALTPLRWAEIGLGALTLTGVIILLVKRKS
jgi:hypothetical protein